MDDMRRAVHETGHLLLALDYGWDVVSISIDNGYGGTGSLLVRHPDEVEIIRNCLLGVNDTYHYDQLLLQLAGGGAAEELKLPGGEQGCHGGENSDFGQFHKLLNLWENFGLDVGALEVTLFSDAIEKAKHILLSSQKSLLLERLPEILVRKRFLNNENLQEELQLITERR